MKYIESITAVDSLGKIYKIDIWQKFIEVTDTSGTHLVPGIKSAFGQHGDEIDILNYEKGEFLVVTTGSKLNRVNRTPNIISK